MAELEDGLYVVRNAANLARALDVRGSGDARGTNVWLWDLNGSAGQTVFVSKRDSGYVIGFPLTGKVLDVPGGEASQGQSVWQWDFNDQPPQYWQVVDTGDVRGIGGVNYPVYLVEFASDTSYMLGTANGSTASGADVVLTQLYAGSDWMKWVFVPIGSVPEGTYKIAPVYCDDTVLGIAGHSSANGASVVLEAEADDTNWQVWKVDPIDDGTCTVRLAQNGRAMDAKRGSASTPANGTDVIAYGYSAAVNQRWVTRAGGTATRNGKKLPTYEIACVWGNNKVLDVAGGGTKPKTNVLLWESHGTDNQRFFLVPTEAYVTGLAVPSDPRLMVGGDMGDASGSNYIVGAAGTVTAYPTWKGSGSEWKVRYRTRTRPVGKPDGYRSDWGPWRSLADGSTANDGWGVPGAANATAELDAGRWVANEGVALTISRQSGYNDLTVVQFQVRQLAHEWGQLSLDAHSGTAACQCRVAYAPAVTIASVTVTPKQVGVAWSSNLARGSNRLRVYVDGLFDATVTGAASSGTVAAKKILRVPENGEQVTVFWELTTVDGVTTTGSVIKTLSVDMGGAASMSATATETAGRVLTVTPQSGATDARLWMTFRGETIEVEAEANGKFRVPYPFGVAFKLTLAGTVGGQLRQWSASYAAREVLGHYWTHSKGWFALVYRRGEPPDQGWRSARSSDARQTTMRQFDLVGLGHGRSQQWSVTGSLVDAIDGSEERVRAFERDCRYAWYRDTHGHVVRVAVTGVSADYKPPFGMDVTVAMTRVDDA